MDAGVELRNKLSFSMTLIFAHGFLAIHRILGFHESAESCNVGFNAMELFG